MKTLFWGLFTTILGAYLWEFEIRPRIVQAQPYTAPDPPSPGATPNPTPTPAIDPSPIPHVDENPAADDPKSIVQSAQDAPLDAQDAPLDTMAAAGQSSPPGTSPPPAAQPAFRTATPYYVYPGYGYLVVRRPWGWHPPVRSSQSFVPRTPQVRSQSTPRVAQNGAQRQASPVSSGGHSSGHR